MVIADVKREWSSRLGRLTGLVEAGERGPAWLWRIRIRILSYLLARYGEPGEPGPPEPSLPEPSPPELAPPEPSPPVFVATSGPPVGVEHPPKPGAVITPILDDIHEANDFVRMARGQDPPPELAWTWWRTAWCRQP
ncbi:MAG: hypothetical protein ACYTGE_00415 [Planctomycetota bacterium]